MAPRGLRSQDQMSGAASASATWGEPRYAHRQSSTTSSSLTGLGFATMFCWFPQSLGSAVSHVSPRFSSLRFWHLLFSEVSSGSQCLITRLQARGGQKGLWSVILTARLEGEPLLRSKQPCLGVLGRHDLVGLAWGEGHGEVTSFQEEWLSRC